MQTNDIGSRIAQRRKTLGLSQTDLARALNLSPQAVSKWENGLGSPDIGLLPDIGRILEMNMNQLLGTEPLQEEEVSFGEDEESYDFPQEYKGLTFVTSYGDRACYSDAKASEVDQNFISFEDGSQVDLNEGLVINRGSQRIDLVYWNKLDREPIYEEKEEQGEENAEVTGYKIDVSNQCTINFLPAKDGRFSWNAQGSARFMDSFEVNEDGGIIHFKVKPMQNTGILSFLNAHNTTGELNIHVPVSKIDSLDVTVRGASDINSSIGFNRANIAISGAGDVSLSSVDDAFIRLSGAGDVNLSQAKAAKIILSGAGDINIGEITGDYLDVQVSGAGDCRVGSGSVQYLKCAISGTGDFRGEKLETVDSDFRLSGFGTAVVGRVSGHSVEKVSKGSTLRILQRG